MNRLISPSLNCWIVLLLLAPLSTDLAAQTPFAGEDFDGGTTNGGFTAISEVFNPDNSVNPGGADDPLDDARFPSSNFDIFGEISRSGGFVPFDLLDDSATTFPTDTFGILESTKTDRVVAISDTENGSNSGPVTATWTFDISGRSNIQLSLDAAMSGDFEAEDTFVFTYSIDGGPVKTAFDITADETNPTVFYGVTLESGNFVDRYETPFFDEGDWLLLTDVGPFGNVGFHPADDGLNGDSVAQDGFVPVESLGGIIEERALSSGPFTNIEKEAYEDPLFVNGDSLTGIQLSDDFTTLSTLLEGSGSTLTLELTAVANSGQEYFVFDNLLLEELQLPGDFNGDNVVDAADYTVWRDNFNAVDDSVLNGNGDETPGVGLSDYDLWVENFGNQLPAATASAVGVPEPSMLGLAALASLTMASARRS